MPKSYRAGGQWVRPWGTMDHVRSHLTSARWMLRKEIAPSEYALLTSDELELIHYIEQALLAVERIMS